jgi:hypothetical protein
MPEIIIKYKSSKTLRLLEDLSRHLGFLIESPASKKTTTHTTKTIPIDFATDPDVTVLAGIWKDREITLEQLRKKAWGNRS